MSARDEILRRVRAALVDAPDAPEVPRSYRSGTANADSDLVDLFVEHIEDYRATVARCAPEQVPQRVMEALGGRRAVVPADLPWEVVGAVVDDGRATAQLDDLDAVVTGASVAIALTGTIVLDHGPAQGRRALSLVPDLHVCVVRADQIVYGVPQAMSRLDPARPQTWISGPSATSDIELNRVEGVHGPRTLHVILTH